VTGVERPEQLRNFVAGGFVEGTAVFDKVSPVDGIVVAQVHEAGAAVVDAAVKAARAALAGAWGRSRVAERVALLRRIADVIEDRADDLLRAEIRDTGKPERQARELDVGRAALNFRAAADAIASAGR